MAKKKKEETIHVSNPKVGSIYYFRFAGSIMPGTLDEVNEKLTIHYGHKWFLFSRTDGGKTMRYPASIYNIAKTENELRNY